VTMLTALGSPAQTGLFLGGAYAVLALLSPRAALWILIPTIALAGEIQVGRVLIRPDDLMLSVLVVVWAGRRLLSPPRTSTPIDRPLAAYFAIGLAATLWGAAIGTADLWGVSKLSASGLHLLKRLEFVLYFCVLRDTLRSTQDVRRFVYLFMASLAAMSISSFGRFQETGHIALGPEGTPIHEPALASMLNVALSLGFLVNSRRAATSALAAAILLGSLWVLPYSYGRNYLVATLLMLAIVGFSRKPSILLSLPILGIFLWIALPALPQHIMARFSTLGSVFAPEASAEGVSIVDRLMPGITHTWEVLTSSPLLGWGLGSVALGRIDNEYAGQIVYTGLLGFAIFLWLASRIARTARETYRTAKQRDLPELPLIAGLQHCLLGYALYSFFSPSISAARAGAFFFTVVGLVAVLHRELVTAPASVEVPVSEAADPLYSGRSRSGGMGWTT